jgi:Protein of unknown function (DUF2478)
MGHVETLRGVRPVELADRDAMKNVSASVMKPTSSSPRCEAVRDSGADIELLEDLATGQQSSIFAGRGRGAKGCQLDQDAMLQVVSQIERELKGNPKLLILNKFGKVEAEGAGMRDLIAKAAWMGIPAIVGVPVCNLHAWREFAGELSAELHDSRDVEGWLVRTVSGTPLEKAAMMDLPP